jgi:hypothetical protein
LQRLSFGEWVWVGVILVECVVATYIGHALLVAAHA